MNIALFRYKISTATELLRALASESRLHIVCQLLKGEKSVKELEDLVGIRQSSMSQHLAILRREDLVKTRREAQSVYYSLSSAEAATILRTLFEVYCAPRKASSSKGRAT